MGMSRCYSLMKCLLILFNIIFLCVGSGACAFAAWALWDGSAGESGAGRAGLCALAAWGCALGVGALAALCGAVRNSASLLAAAFALLALTAVAEGAAAWWGAAHLPHLRRALRDRLDHTVVRDYGVSRSRTQVMDALQHGLQCCGAESVRDWQNSAWSVSQEARQAQGARGGAGGPVAGARVLDLSVSAEPTYYWVPESCCSEPEGCARARRVAAAPGAGGAGAGGAVGGLHAAGCGERALAALERGARAPLAAAAALLATHAAALLLALALCLRAHPDHGYKA